LLLPISGAFGGILDIYELQPDNGPRMSRTSGAKSPYRSIERSRKEGKHKKKLDPRLDRVVGRVAHYREQLDPQLDRVVGRVMITENNSTHNSTELWTELHVTECNSTYNSTEL